MNNLYKLFRLQCQDLVVLQEMEYNGIVWQRKEAEEYAAVCRATQKTLLEKFNQLIDSNVVSITSNDHVSAVLYGGTIIETIRVKVGHYKTGKREGEVKMGKKEIEHVFPRLVTPKVRTETKKSKDRQKKGETDRETIWQVAEPVLRVLKAKDLGKQLIDIILEANKLEKLAGSALEGYGKLIDKMGWDDGMLHPTLNQCVAVTGRLSSSKPNGQNADKRTKTFMETRY